MRSRRSRSSRMAATAPRISAAILHGNWI
jgi:hypothetical protein